MKIWQMWQIIPEQGLKQIGPTCATLDGSKSSICIAEEELCL